MRRFLYLALLFLGGCDPGFTYYPEGWEPQGAGYEWAQKFNGVQIRTWGIGELIGSDWISPEFGISNRTAEAVVVEGAELLVASGTYPGGLPANGELEWRKVKPGATLRIPLSWKFERPALEVLGQQPRIILELQQGGQSRRITIKYARAK